MGNASTWRKYNFSRKYNDTIRECTNAIASDPNSDPNLAIAYKYRADAYAKTDKFDLAINDYSQAINLKSDYAAAYRGRGKIYSNHLSDYEKAISDYSKIIELETKETEKVKAYKLRGFAYDRNGDYDLAIGDYTNVIRRNPNDHVAYNSRGFVHGRKSDYKQATADHETAIQLNPNYAVAYNNLGFAYSCKGEYACAIKHLSIAISLRPTYHVAFSNRGFAYFSIGEYDMAIDDLNEAIKLEAIYAKAYRIRAHAYARKKEFDEAFNDHAKDIHYSNDPQNLASAYNAKGLTHALKGNHSKAMKDYNKAIDYNSNLSCIYLNIGDLHRVKGDVGEAIKNYDNAVLFSPNQRIDSVDRNFAHNAGDAIENACKLLTRKISSLAKGEPDYDYYLGVLCLFKNNSLAAKRKFKHASDNGYHDSAKVDKHIKNLSKIKRSSHLILHVNHLEYR